MFERWTTVKDCGVLKEYHVSDAGNVRNAATNRIMKQHLNIKGYPMVTLRTPNGKKKLTIHRIVAKSWLIPVDGKTHINHVDGIKTNNSPKNLEWCTPKENTQHALKTGLLNINGERGPLAKLTESQVLEIRARTNIIFTEVAKEYGVSEKAIRLIISRETWKHI